MRIVIFSDTHGFHNQVQLPYGDLLICCGDVCGTSTISEILSFANWFTAQPHTYKICCPGNHDWPMENNWDLCKEALSVNNSWLLHDMDLTIENLKIYATAWQPFFNNWAFNVADEDDLALKYSRIPDDTNILITHCPPKGIMDFCLGQGNVGPASLLSRVNKIKPLLHCFGHIHSGYGKYESLDTTFINASICTEYYAAENFPVVLDLE